MYKATVKVSLKASVLDPQGKTILSALHSLGFDEAKGVRVGKYFEMVLEGKDKKSLENRIRQFSEKLLVNPVIEQYSFEVNEL